MQRCPAAIEAMMLGPACVIVHRGWRGDTKNAMVHIVIPISRNACLDAHQMDACFKVGYCFFVVFVLRLFHCLVVLVLGMKHGRMSAVARKRL